MTGARDGVPLLRGRGQCDRAEGDPEPPALGPDPAGRQQAVRHRLVSAHRGLEQRSRRSRHGKKAAFKSILAFLEVIN